MTQNTDPTQARREKLRQERAALVNSPAHKAMVDDFFSDANDPRPGDTTLTAMEPAYDLPNGNGKGKGGGKPQKRGPEVDALAAWLAEQKWSEFAVSLAEFHGRKGYLSEKQFASGTSMRTKVEANAKAKEPELATKTTGLDLTDLPSGTYAVPGGTTRLKVSVNRPGPNSNWSGHVFVTDGAEYGNRKNYGRQAPGKTYVGDIADELAAIMADPYEALTAYGKITGTCGACGRKLEDETSVAEGIGPVCKGKF